MSRNTLALFLLLTLATSTWASEVPDNAQGGTGSQELFQITRWGSDREFRSKLASVEDVDQTLPDGSTLLMWAIASGKTNRVKALLTRGSDPNARTRTQRTPIMVAAAGSNVSIVRLLLNAGSDIDARDQVGQSALFHSVLSGSISMTRAIAKHSSHLNTRDKLFGSTPLHLALEMNRKKQASVLLKLGADPSIPDASGTSPLAWCTNRPQVSACGPVLRHAASGRDEPS